MGSNKCIDVEVVRSVPNMCQEVQKVNPPKRRISRKPRTYLSTWFETAIGVPEIAEFTGQAANTVTEMFRRGLYHGERRGKYWRTTRGQLITDLHNLRMKDADE